MKNFFFLILPWVCGIAGGIVWWAFKPKFPLDEKEFLAAAISLGAVLTGFIATAKAILAALPSDSVMGRIRESGYINDLVMCLAHALYGCLAFSLLSLVGFFLLEPNKQSLPLWYSSGWIALGIFSAVAFLRVSRILFLIIKFNPQGRD